MQRGAATIAKAAMHAPSLSEDRIFAGGRGRQDRVTSSTGFPGMKGFELAASVRSIFIRAYSVGDGLSESRMAGSS